MSVYLLHLDPPLHRASHYCGYTPDRDVTRRVSEHLACGSKASPLVRAAVQAGSRVVIARTWNGPEADRVFERRIKNRKKVRKLCPVCSGQGVLNLES